VKYSLSKNGDLWEVRQHGFFRSKVVCSSKKYSLSRKFLLSLFSKDNIITLTIN